MIKNTFLRLSFFSFLITALTSLLTFNIGHAQVIDDTEVTLELAKQTVEDLSEVIGGYYSSIGVGECFLKNKNIKVYCVYVKVKATVKIKFVKKMIKDEFGSSRYVNQVLLRYEKGNIVPEPSMTGGSGGF
jgi:hypothetical protein